MLMTFEFFSQVFSTTIANSLKALLRLVVSDILDVLIHLMDDVRFLMNANSSLLSLMIEHFLELMCSSVMETTIVKGT